MSDFDFTKPATPQPASPDGFDFTKGPGAPAGSSAPFKAGQSQFYNAAVAKKLFQESGKEERFKEGQKLFEEAEKGGMFKATRMYYLVEGEVALSIGGKPLDTVKAGEIFGEMAVISDRPRSASAVAKNAATVFSLDKNGLVAALEKNPEFALMLMSVMFDRLRFIAARLATRKAGPMAREASVFDPVMLQQLEAALPRANVMRYQANAHIMREGQAGIYMYVVKTGQVAISIKDKLVEVVNPGGTFGEMALVDQSPRVANALSLIYTELLTIDRPSLLEAVKSRPSFAVAMLRAVADRLRHMNSQLS
jgi:CRP/FNR family cyclic AMP-dependent transcriptional regulator